MRERYIYTAIRQSIYKADKKQATRNTRPGYRRRRKSATQPNINVIKKFVLYQTVSSRIIKTRILIAIYRGS